MRERGHFTDEIYPTAADAAPGFVQENISGWAGIQAAVPAFEHREQWGILVKVDEAQATFFSLWDGQFHGLSLAEPLSRRVEAMLVRVLFSDGQPGLLWDAPADLVYRDQERWQPVEQRLPLSLTDIYLPASHFGLRSPTEIWVAQRYAAVWDGQNWQPVSLPSPTAQFVAPWVALDDTVFYLWHAGSWQVTGPFPPAPDPFVGALIACNGHLWYASNEGSWETAIEEKRPVRGALRVLHWDGRSWRWETLHTGESPDQVASFVCVNGTPWLILHSGRRVLKAPMSVLVNRRGGRFASPEEGMQLDYAALWRWNGNGWQPAVQAPLWGDDADDRLQGIGLGVAAVEEGWLATAGGP